MGEFMGWSVAVFIGGRFYEPGPQLPVGYKKMSVTKKAMQNLHGCGNGSRLGHSGHGHGDESQQENEYTTGQRQYKRNRRDDFFNWVCWDGLVLCFGLGHRTTRGGSRLLDFRF